MFVRIFLIATFLFFGETLAYIFRGNLGSFNILVTRIANLMVFAMNIAMANTYVRYVSSVFVEKGAEVSGSSVKIANIFSCINIFIVVVNLFYPWMYYFDEANYYHRNNSWYVYTLISLVVIFIGAGMAIKYRKYLEKRSFISMMLFSFIPIIATVVQSFIYGFSITNLGLGIGSFVMFAAYMYDWSHNGDEHTNMINDSRFDAVIMFLSTMDKAYQVRRLFLRDEARNFKLTKELRNLDLDGLGERETLIKVYEFFKTKYNLGSNMRVNRENLEAGGYNFSHEIDSKILQGIFRTTEDMASGFSKHSVNVQTQVNTHSHGIYLLHSVDEIKTVTGMQSQKVKNILRRMFSKGKKTKYKFIALENSDFYAFIINNVKQLKFDFKSVTSQMGGTQMNLILEPKTAPFSIPEMELYKYCEVKNRMFLRLNAYKEYTNEFITDKTRSMPERLFERYCEKAPGVKWVYKNGDTGQQYLSIVYADFIQHQWLFYPDYIVEMDDGTTWIIETKGGEVSGHSKNIDVQVGNKFNAFKNYAEKYGIKWGLVRDIDEELFINNTEYVEDMSDPNWRPLSEEF